MSVTVTESMSFDAFKDRLHRKVGGHETWHDQRISISFREVGKHGWTSVEDILDKKPGGQSGPHWCDAAPIPCGQWLLGKYDFNAGVATFFVKNPTRVGRFL